MSDARTEANYRSGSASLREVMDRLPAYTTARVRSTTTTYQRDSCVEESTTRFENTDPNDSIRLLALCGFQEARDMSVWGTLGIRDSLPSLHWLDQKAKLPQWFAMLRELVTRLPPRRAKVTAPSPREKSNASFASETNTWHLDVAAEKWLLVVCAVAAARECQLLSSRVPPLDFLEREASLKATEAWIAEPSEKQRERARRVWGNGTSEIGEPDWLPYPDDRDAINSLLAAAEVLTPEKVREITCAAIIDAVLPPGTRRDDV